MNPQEFVNKWRNVELKERSFYQEHFLDLCHLVGHETPVEFDPKGTKFSFEAGAGRGFADVWKKGYFAWEYKGDRKDLEAAYDQLLRYRESLENPPLLIVADHHLIRIHTNFTNTVKKEYELELDDLLDPDKLEILRAAFFDPQRLKAEETPEQVTEQAAKEFARLAEILRKWGEDNTKTAHFLIRLLFCLFAEDVGLLPKDLFTRIVARTRRNAQAFTGQLRSLFGTMSTGGWFGEHEIVQFNGGLFDSDNALELDSEGIDILAAVSGLDWSSIEPSILGTLFERSLDPSKRSQLGAHYTSREDILLIVEPVLMKPLRRRWEKVEKQARKLAEERDIAEGKRMRANREKDIQRLLDEFAAEIRAVRVLDPACGSGNFLYVALRQLLELWREVSNLSAELGLPMMLPTSAPSPEQLYGIEINDYAHELAQATIWIGYIQWLRENGFGQPSQPILKKLDNIKQMDAILAYDEDGKPVEPEWPEADVVIGNPPFLGDKKMRGELGNGYVENVRKLYEGRVPGGADLVTYWFERSRSFIEKGKVKRSGLLATQSIRVGANRSILEQIKASGDIFMAWSDRPWILDGAQVRVSIVGFDNKSETERTLDGKKVKKINSNLTSKTDITKSIPLDENNNFAFIGTQKGGKFEINSDLACKMISDIGNPNGKSNKEVVKPWLNGTDITGRPRGMYIIDFDPELSKSEASLYEMPFEYVKQNVKPKRMQNSVKSARENWWLHERTRPAMRSALVGLSRFIASPRVSKYRMFAFVDIETNPDSRIVVIARDDNYFFGVLHSLIHEIWSLATSPRHGVGNDPTYNAESCFKTFPFPWPPGEESQDDPLVLAIAEAAKELNEKRERWLNPERVDEKELKKRTLTNLYNERPTWLDLLHKKLDEVVLDAYGWPHDISDEEILERLLALNLKRAGK